MHLVPKIDNSTLPLFTQYLHKFTGEIHVSYGFDGSDTLSYTSITISDSIIDVPMATSSERDDIMPENRPILLKVPFFGMVSTLQIELAFRISMMLSDIVMLVYFNVSELSKSVGTTFSLRAKSCT